ncbi:unnamed protein product, partial [Heterotrigona itama]
DNSIRNVLNTENCVIVTIGGQVLLIDWHKLERTGLKWIDRRKTKK